MCFNKPVNGVFSTEQPTEGLTPCLRCVSFLGYWCMYIQVNATVHHNTGRELRMHVHPGEATVPWLRKHSVSHHRKSMIKAEIF